MRFLIATIAFVATWSPSCCTGASRPFSSRNLAFTNRKSIATTSLQPPSNDPLLNLRGGASKSRRRKKRGSRTNTLSTRKRTASGATKVGKQTQEPTKFDKQLQRFKTILPLTRLYISAVAIMTIVGTVLGDDNSSVYLALDPTRFIYGLEFWRLFTAASFLGKPSIQWLMSGYYLFEYGSNIEAMYGSAQHLIFLMSQFGTLAALCMLFGIPFFAASVITSKLYVLSRVSPHANVKWLIFTVPYWALPWMLMVTDVLQAKGNPASAVPHIMGILTGHLYYYHKFIWPKMGGEDWLVAPDWLVRRMDPDSANLDVGRKKMEAVLKNRKKGKGRKLSAK